MPPPPVPIDPALDAFNTLNVTFSSGIGDHLLQPSPAVQERLRYPGTTSSLGAFLQDVQLPAMRQPDLDQNPMSRFQNDPGPWTPQRIGGDVAQHPQAPRYQGSYGSNYFPATVPSQYREPPRSELGSSTTGRNLVDSGYGSRSLATKSVRSAEPMDQSQSCQSLIEDVNDMRVYPDETFTSHIQGNDLGLTNEVSYPYPLPATEPAESPPVPLICTHPDCGNESKNLSEYKYATFSCADRSLELIKFIRKHQLRHTKPFRCQEPGCPRKDGFSTKNDLERHRKSLHKIAPKNPTDRSFRCAATNCPKRDKIWPRLDNFRQHCTRMHADENVDDLVTKSVVPSNVCGYMEC